MNSAPSSSSSRQTTRHLCVASLPSLITRENSSGTGDWTNSRTPPSDMSAIRQSCAAAPATMLPGQFTTSRGDARRSSNIQPAWLKTVENSLGGAVVFPLRLNLFPHQLCDVRPADVAHRADAGRRGHVDLCQIIADY